MDAALVNSSLVPAGRQDWSLRQIAAAHGTPDYSLRELLSHRDRSRVSTWAVCLLVFTGATPVQTMPMDWYDRMFFEPEGVAAFFRRMSGGRLLVEWQVFGPLTLATFAEKKQFALAGTEDAVYTARALAQGVPLDRFQHVVWIPDEGVSRGGTGAGTANRFAGALDISPQLVCHELTHQFGVCSHADRTTLDDYADPFCIMGQWKIARSWESPTLTWPGVFPHGTVGPGVQAAYLFEAGWLAYSHNVIQLGVGDLPDAVGLSFPLACNDGAPLPGDERKIAITVGGVPFHPDDPVQVWVEYRRPEGFDRALAAPFGSAAPDLPPSGGVIVHTVAFGSARCPGARRSVLVGWYPATTGQAIALPGFERSLRVSHVDDARREITVTVQ